MSELLAWKIQPLDSQRNSSYFAFAEGFKFKKSIYAKELTRNLPEGVVICSAQLVAGLNHLKHVLEQSAEYWSREIFIARNLSIDLLMRVTCQDQISRAVQISGIESLVESVLFGLMKDQSIVVDSEYMIRTWGGIRDDSLLNLYPSKSKYLKGLHNLPSKTCDSDLPMLLQEKSISLAFSK